MTEAARLELAVEADGLGQRQARAWERARRRDLLWQVLLPFAVVVPLLLAWELYAQSQANPFLPGPSDVLAALPTVLTGPVLEGFIATNVAMLQGT
jgi:ABC-type nitrate/sulfonate/bicarbonate transport system permease component